MPPVTEFIPKGKFRRPPLSMALFMESLLESGDDSDDDDDLEVGAVTQDFKCPLSLRPLENPLTSSVFLMALQIMTVQLDFTGKFVDIHSPQSQSVQCLETTKV